MVSKTHRIASLVVAHVSILKLGCLFFTPLSLLHHSVRVGMSFALLEGRSGSHISILDLSKTKLAVALRRLHQVFDRVIHNSDDPLSLARFIRRSHGASCSLVESVNPFKSLA